MYDELCRCCCSCCYCPELTTYCNYFGIADETATLSSSGAHAKFATRTRWYTPSPIFCVQQQEHCSSGPPIIVLFEECWLPIRLWCLWKSQQRWEGLSKYWSIGNTRSNADAAKMPILSRLNYGKPHGYFNQVKKSDTYQRKQRHEPCRVSILKNYPSGISVSPCLVDRKHVLYAGKGQPLRVMWRRSSGKKTRLCFF